MKKLDNLFHRIKALNPQAMCGVSDDDYDTIIWKGPGDLPSFEELQAVDLEAIQAEEKNKLQKKCFLFETDSQVLKNYEENLLGLTPTLSDSELTTLLQQRQEARNIISG